MAIDLIRPVVALGNPDVGAASRPPDGSRAKRLRPAVMLVRSVAMVVLAGLGILVVLPAAIAAQAASAL